MPGSGERGGGWERGESERRIKESKIYGLVAVRIARRSVSRYSRWPTNSSHGTGLRVSATFLSPPHRGRAGERAGGGEGETSLIETKPAVPRFRLYPPA